MTKPLAARDLARRLPWLLVFRAAVATALLALTITADLSDWPLRRISEVLYGVVGGTYLVVFVLGLLLRTKTSPIVVSAVHLATAVMAALMVVSATGGLTSAFSFLYLLVILDAAIVGGQRVAIAVASACSLAYGSQLVLQLYRIFPENAGVLPSPAAFTASAIIHIGAFYLTALLAGHLAGLLRRAREAASTARLDLHYVQELYSNVVRALPLGLVTVSYKNQIQTVNEASLIILGETRETLINHAPSGALQAMLSAPTLSGEIESTADGTARHLFYTRFNLGADTTEEPITVLLFEDRTNVRVLEQALATRERLASLGQMAAGIAHELRNPLAAISGSVELLGSSEVAPDTQRRLRDIVLREIQRLNRLVQGFLDYARPAPLERMVVNVSDLVQEIATVCRADEKWQHLHLVVDAPSICEARVDPGQLRQVLWNLLRNAADASPQDASVVMQLREHSDRTVLFQIADSGAGIPKEFQRHLFEPFHTSKPDGTGLGLALVQRVVELHGGTIELDSATGKGTTVRIVLPRAIA